MKTETRLPTDPAIVKIAAVAGRSTEAKAKLRELMAAEANDEEIAVWLAPILFSDPSWLDTFISSAPEDRRITLARLTILKLGELSPDAAWDLIRASPYARLAASSHVEVENRRGVDILGYCRGSKKAAETILDASLGFSDEEIARILRFASGEENARRILEEWVNGRWKGEPPEFVRSSWDYMRSIDKHLYLEWGKNLPTELRSYAAQFEALHEMDELNSGSSAGPVLTVESISGLGPGELAEIFERQATAGNHIPLDTITRLPPELRKIGIENYFQQNSFFHSAMAWECVEQMEHLDLTNLEKQSLLEGAATSSWQKQGDYITALEWAGRMPDVSARTRFEEMILTELAQQDPHAALDHAGSMPAGALRKKVEQLATEALP